MYIHDMAVNLILCFNSEQAPETNWNLVVDHFDHEGFYLPDQKSFNTLLGIYGMACKVWSFCEEINRLVYVNNISWVLI